MNKVIVVAAHPDDETLGSGGTLLKYKALGYEIYWLIVTGVFENQGFSKEKIEEREKEIEKVADLYGFTKTFRLDYPTMSLSGSDLKSMIPRISDIFNEVRPNILLCLNRSDAHSDHRIIFDAVAACTKSFRYPSIKQVMMYECISETEFAPALPERAFLPNYFVDISDFIQGKIEIIQVFKSELGVHPFPRTIENIKALAHYRGTMAGVEYAEAFQLIKFIDK